MTAVAVLLALAGLVRVVGGDEADPTADEPRPAAAAPTGVPEEVATEVPVSAPATSRPPRPVGSTHAANGRIFGEGRFLVAYYGTGGTGSLGVLGETDPASMHRRLERAARPFAGLGREGSRVQLVYELIVTVADRGPGPDGDFSHDVPRSVVRQYVDAARRRGALLLLDLQPGRSRFVDVARRWEWALREPHVGLAIDPEWRMARDEVPGTVIGSVSAKEVDLVSGWLDGVRRRNGLPEKLFVIHQFRTDMVRGIDRVEDRPGLAMVQHVDGFGTPGQKLDTYRTVERSRRFDMGFKLFYDEDVPRMSAREVRSMRPAVRFVSFQ
ncbi:MAG: hypothetical protein JWN84_2456 [Nocardioides sp.]|nr:hypothetical protein [Nocardioides sp.]